MASGSRRSYMLFATTDNVSPVFISISTVGNLIITSLSNKWKMGKAIKTHHLHHHLLKMVGSKAPSPCARILMTTLLPCLCAHLQSTQFAGVPWRYHRTMMLVKWKWTIILSAVLPLRFKNCNGMIFFSLRAAAYLLHNLAREYTDLRKLCLNPLKCGLRDCDLKVHLRWWHVLSFSGRVFRMQ